ncbi:hypothetical protein PMIN06_012150 [Paraphaeosphaeria minitans]|uniref:Uncharacterized protein n=1 Tax=Paraphaeosphaeria minitans TaxID=565426 RepID=A0A9P6GA63_9PLEO|nr:hypothetical protein PMIN01_10671 [Paraphaeosphaeria minitans]
MPWCAVVQLIGQTACGVVYVGSGVRLDWSPAPDVVVRQMGSVVAGVPSLTRAQLSEAATAARCGVATADVNVGATAAVYRCDWQREGLGTALARPGSRTKARCTGRVDAATQRTGAALREDNTEGAATATARRRRRTGEDGWAASGAWLQELEGAQMPDERGTYEYTTHVPHGRLYSLL